MQGFGLIDILLLPAFRAAAKQDDECFAVTRQIDTISRPQSTTYSPIPPNHFTLDVLPSSNRSLAVTIFAAAWTSKLSNHFLYGFDPSARRYS